MDTKDIVYEFIDRFGDTLNEEKYELESTQVFDLKADAHSILYDILKKHGLIKDITT